MKLEKIEIKNYRNLDGIKLVFNPTVNFLVGENNLGKSNFLLLLNTIFNKTYFSESDFTNLNEPIEVFLSLVLEDIEIGLFEDLCDPEKSNTINLIARQETIDDPIGFWHPESSTNVSAGSVKCLNFIYYDSIRKPSNELTFDKRKGVGRFLNHIFTNFLEAKNIKDIDLIEGRVETTLSFHKR